MRVIVAAFAAAVLAMGGCADTGATGDGRENGAAPPANGEPPGTAQGTTGKGTTGKGTTGQGGLVELRVLADDSLTDAFGTVEERFEQQHPNVEVVVAYAEGGSLARRIAGGEAADVFATDDLFAMRTVTDAGKAGTEPVEFGGGRLTVTVLPQVAQPAAAASFVDFLRGGDGKRVLIETGLLRP